MDEDEKVIREALSKKLGVEFCSEEDLKQEGKKAELERAQSAVAIAEERSISASEIITRCNEAQKKMSRTNPNRFLLFLCATMIRSLIDQLEEMKKQLVVH